MAQQLSDVTGRIVDIKAELCIVKHAEEGKLATALSESSALDIAAAGSIGTAALSCGELRRRLPVITDGLPLSA